jgi:hypothetical protein
MHRVENVSTVSLLLHRQWQYRVTLSSAKALLDATPAIDQAAKSHKDET